MADQRPSAVIRTPDQRLRVFVSSTLEELAPERRAVREAIERLHLTPVMFELGARPYPPRSLYRAYLDQSHVFIAIYWQRYGWIAPEEDVSGLEDEYRLSHDMPRLIYVKEPAPDREPRLHALLERVMADDRASFKRFSTPEELDDLVADDLAILLTERFEAPVAARTAVGEPVTDEAARVPVPATPLVGREEEIEEIIEIVTDPATRLLTLTGPGGIGKSRLAYEAAAHLAVAFPDGSRFVGLGAVRDPALVAPTIAHALRVRESAGTSPFENLKGYLADKSMLLVLDNFEQVASAAPLVADLLASARDLVVLVTSRTTLRIRGEHDLVVEPLRVPDSLRRQPDLAALRVFPAVQLFVERAQAVKPGFELTEDNAAAIAEICQRLDGMPLAIELAAARIRVLPPAALLERLTSSLNLLTGGARDLPERQRTLRATLDWDHDLLDETEQILFRRLSVFSGDWSLEAVEAIVPTTDDPPIDVLDGIESLLGKSLIRSLDPTDSEPRLGMLNIIREYAAERLDAAGEADAVRRRHADYYLELAEMADTKRRGPNQAQWMNRLEQEHDNLRAALRWADERLEVDLEVRLVAALGWFWLNHAHFTEGRQWVDRALSLSVGDHTTTRAQLLEAGSYLFKARGDRDRAWLLLNEALGIRRETGDADNAATVLKMMGVVENDRGNLDAAIGLFEQSIALRPRDGDERAQAETLNNLGVVARYKRDLEAAVRWFEQALAVFRRAEDDEGIARVMMNLGNVNVDRGDLVAAKEQSHEALRLFKALGSTWDMVDVIEDLAWAAGEEGRGGRAGVLFGAAEALREATGAVRPEPEQEDYERHVADARAHGPETFEAGWTRGRTMTVEQTVDFVLEDEDEPPCASTV